jgi:hypothetical protein
MRVFESAHRLGEPTGRRLHNDRVASGHVVQAARDTDGGGVTAREAQCRVRAAG